MAHITFISDNHDVQMTVGRADISGATASASTNIVSDISPLVLPQTSPAYYMGAISSHNGKNLSLSGHATDTPGTGTFYYTIWMSSNALHLYTGMTAVLTVLKILP
jgi:hypothetical protein